MSHQLPAAQAVAGSSVDRVTRKVDIGKLSIRKAAGGGSGAKSSVEQVPANAAHKGGEGGLAGSPALPLSNAAFLAQMIVGVAGDATAAVCSKAGDPSNGPWTAESADDVDHQCLPDRNNYFNCSSFSTDADGNVRATKDRISAYHVLVFDDVGSKIDRSKFVGFVPTWEIETSPGNSQIGVRLAQPIYDQQAVKHLQDTVIAAGLSDPGAGGAARWVRLPYAINGKPKYRNEAGNPFLCNITAWNPGVSYTVDELFATLGLTPVQTTSTSGRQGTSNVERPLSLPHGDDGDEFSVLTAKPAGNPVVAAIKARGLYKGQIAPGKHDVTCPWTQEHTDAIDGGAAYFEPNREYPVGGFCCQHSHGDRYRVKQLLDYLNVKPEQARDKAIVRIVPGELNHVIRAAEQVLSKLGGFFQSGGVIVAVRNDGRSGDISTEMVSEAALSSALSEAADWFKFDGQSKKWQRTDPPVRIVQALLKAQVYEHLPTLTGLSRQPFFRETDGELVMVPGYDAASGQYGAFDPAKFDMPEPTLEAAQAALSELDTLLDEFHFATPEDRSAAVCAMLTGAVRPSLPVAPAFNITASTPGSGKSYLSSAIVPFAGPGVAAKVSYPTTADEATKTILSLFLQAPAAVVFDDMQTQWLAFGAINRMLTSPTISDRVLGVSRTVTVGTRSLFIGTGNNVGPVQDMRRRVITIRLAPRTATPATIRYTGRPAETVIADRERYVGLALTIVRAWLKAGSPRADVCSIASYNGPWDAYCRQPLLWLGRSDPASSLIDQLAQDPDQADLGNMLRVWHDTFGDASKTLRSALNAAEDLPLLAEAFLDLPGQNGDVINRDKLGWFFKRNEGRIVDGLMIQNGDSTERKSWRVVAIGTEADGASPPLPPSRSEPRA
jgi:hypothetical protein